MLHGNNALSPDRMRDAERIDEIASILALGLVRLKARQSSRTSAVTEKSSVDFTGHQSGHAAVILSTTEAP